MVSINVKVFPRRTQKWKKQQGRTVSFSNYSLLKLEIFFSKQNRAALFNLFYFFPKGWAEVSTLKCPWAFKL